MTKKEGPKIELLRWGPNNNYARRVTTPNSGPEISNLPNRVKTKKMSALLVVIDVLSRWIPFFLKLLSYEPKAMPKYGRYRQISIFK